MIANRPALRHLVRLPPNSAIGQWDTKHDKGVDYVNKNYVAQAKGLLSTIGVHKLSEGVWALTDVHIASQA